VTLITSIQQIEENFNILQSSIAKLDSRAIDLVRNGKSIVVANFGDKLAFAPSRFLGYRNNDIDQHIKKRSKRDGKKTNPAIGKALGFDKSSNEAAESAFLLYCKSLGSTPPKNQRKYWLLPDAIELVDLGAVAKDTTTNKTEKLQLHKARLGQGKFRSDLEEKWNGCSVTGCTIREVLRASHIKPWKDCDNSERLDADNGLLLVANIDALFDTGLISFEKNGALVCSKALSKANLKLLAGCTTAKLNLNPQQALYMQIHRKLHRFA